jgi:WD40 repeat protein
VSRDLTTAALVEQEEVSLVDTETGGRRSLPGGPADSVFFTQDHLLVLRPDGAVEIWKADGRRLVASATGGGYRVALAAPMDGHLLARLRTDDSITVTLSESGDSLGSLALPPTNGYITRIAFTEDGEFLVAGTAGGSLTRWDMTETAWLSHACDAAGRDLNSEEWQRYVGTATPTDLGCRR